MNRKQLNGQDNIIINNLYTDKRCRYIMQVSLCFLTNSCLKSPNCLDHLCRLYYSYNICDIQYNYALWKVYNLSLV